MKVNSEMSSIC